MTPDELAKAGTEHAHQKALFAYTNCAALYGFDAADNALVYNRQFRDAALEVHGCHPVPVLTRLFAIHNQGHGDAIRGGRARAEGVKAGVPDIMLPISNGFHHGLFVELKKPKNGVISDDQHDWIAYLRNEMYAVAVCYGWREAADAIKWYLNYK
jgi:hypothetical protein